VYVGFCSVVLLSFAIRSLTRGLFPLAIGLPSVEKQDLKIPNACGLRREPSGLEAYLRAVKSAVGHCLKRCDLCVKRKDPHSCYINPYPANVENRVSS
jgi:hypothetical protein